MSEEIFAEFFIGKNFYEILRSYLLKNRFTEWETALRNIFEGKKFFRVIYFFRKNFIIFFPNLLSKISSWFFFSRALSQKYWRRSQNYFLDNFDFFLKILRTYFFKVRIEMRPKRIFDNFFSNKFCQHSFLKCLYFLKIFILCFSTNYKIFLWILCWIRVFWWFFFFEFFWIERKKSWTVLSKEICLGLRFSSHLNGNLIKSDFVKDSWRKNCIFCQVKKKSKLIFCSWNSLKFNFPLLFHEFLTKYFSYFCSSRDLQEKGWIVCLWLWVSIQIR